MRTIIAGSRHYDDYRQLRRLMRSIGFPITEVVSGCAPGADTLGEMWAAENGIPWREFPADWKRYRRAAGPIRNRQMADYADALVAFLAPGSRGTADMIKQAESRNLPMVVFNI